MPKIYLASKSPRRQELLKLMGLEYTLYIKDIDESYPESLRANEVAEYIAKKKANAFAVSEEGVIVTADTVVVVDNEILGKPLDADDASAMLRKLSGRKHEVITGVCIVSKEHQVSFSEVTEVHFRTLQDTEIDYYIKNYKPFDKAGAYGIQEWIGVTAITGIVGSYTNVVGLPTEKLYEGLKDFGFFKEGI
ncbi:Maf family nucleotide pyrophosphatase [Pseudopedobacter sp.]|uniref:Maf family nucleotide pyrophosphatase n=1 Tax=Pseudopedobacter sp. TaxID=1936787 RepID=UPI00333FD26F